VRGIDLVGTPFAAFSNLVAAGESTEVFNGTCGAESGWVPVSAVAPSLLFERLEFQLKEKGQERPPLLAKPAVSDGSAASPARSRCSGSLPCPRFARKASARPLARDASTAVVRP